jgi:hypothetical protein
MMLMMLMMMRRVVKTMRPGVSIFPWRYAEIGKLERFTFSSPFSPYLYQFFFRRVLLRIVRCMIYAPRFFFRPGFCTLTKKHRLVQIAIIFASSPPSAFVSFRFSIFPKKEETKISP